MDVVNAISDQNLILPSGTSKIGLFEYDVDINGSPKTVDELNQLPIKTVGNTTIYIGDVAHVRDGFPPQTNIVRVNGQRAALLTVMKAGNASTLSVIAGIKAMLPQILAGLPPELKIQPLADQSLFVRASINGVIREGVIAACLTGLMILIFSGQLAEHSHHRGFHPAFHSHVSHRAQHAGRNHQHHDPGRTGARGRHSGRRRHG